MLRVVTDVSVPQVKTEEVAVCGLVELAAVAPGTEERGADGDRFAALRSVHVLPVADRAERNPEAACHLGVPGAVAQEGQRPLSYFCAVAVHVTTLSQ